MKTHTQQKFGRREIKKIAKEYGFWIEFSYIYGKGSWYTMFQRINKKEADAYSKGKNEFGDPIEYVCGEEDRFENEEHCRKYFKCQEDWFLDANPSLNNKLAQKEILTPMAEQIINGVKIEVLTTKSLYVTIGDYTYYIDDSTNEQIIRKFKRKIENPTL